MSCLIVVECLRCLFCSPSASPPDPKHQKVVGAEFAGDEVPAGGSAETAGTDPSTTSAGVVTVALAGTSPSASVTPPLVTSTVVIKPQALRPKKSGMKKSSL
jgi:hypothetical protein